MVAYTSALNTLYRHTNIHNYMLTFPNVITLSCAYKTKLPISYFHLMLPQNAMRTLVSFPTPSVLTMEVLITMQ